jgi:hypothetical protein
LACINFQRCALSAPSAFILYLVSKHLLEFVWQRSQTMGFMDCRLQMMHYRLCFFDNRGRVQDSCEADLGSADSAMRWMRIVGSAWGLHSDWSRIELWCQGHCVARIRMEVPDDCEDPEMIRSPARSCLLS